MKPLNGNGEGEKTYDPAFTGNRTQPLHRWVPWAAGYSAQFVDDVLDIYNGRTVHSRVLDPFAGVGTTLVEARFRGCDVVGCELNPYATLVSRTKLAAGTELRSASLRMAAANYRRFSQVSKEPKSKPPDGFRSRRPFFTMRVQREVLLALDFISSIEDAWTRDAFRVALGAILISVSNYVYGPSLSAAEKPTDNRVNVAQALLAKISQMAEDVAGLEQANPRDSERNIYNASFFDNPTRLGQVDLVITSPPYLNNYHYVRNTRPQMWWLGLVSNIDELSRMEQENIGKYWQTVRDSEPISLSFDHNELSLVLAHLRETRQSHGMYGGPGWANYAASYFNDTYRYLKLLSKTLRSGGYAVIVVGNSILQGVPIATDRFVAEIGGLAGFTHVATNTLRNSRVGDSIVGSSVRRGVRRQEGIGLYESAVILGRLV